MIPVELALEVQASLHPSIELAEEVKNEIWDSATPYSTYVRGVIVDGDRGVLLTGRDERALSIEG